MIWKFLGLGVENQLKTLVSELQALSKFLETSRRIPSTPIELRRIAVEDSARYVYENFPDVQVFSHREETLHFAIKQATVDGHFLEFGVNTGATLRQCAEALPDQQFFGFDSFRGLPEDWGGTNLLKGRFDRGGKLPKMPNNVELVSGWFEDSIPEWKKKHAGPIGFCHVDSDLYSSAVTIFTELEEFFVDGTIIAFDEYFGYADWRNGEHKAFLEMIERTGSEYKALAISHMALVLKIIKR